MNLYEYLLGNLEKREDGKDAVQDLALRKVFSYLRPYRGVKDLTRHIEDMVQTILIDWYVMDVDESMELRQVITFAQERARFVIQNYLEKYEFVVEVPRVVQRSKANAPESTELEYADLQWRDREDVNGTMVLMNAWRGALYDGMSIRDSWVIWFLSNGFGINQVAVLQGCTPKTVRRVIERVKASVN
jgi:hypothetical protein